MTPATNSNRAKGRREALRLERHRSALTNALRIVTADGLDGLTMLRLARDVGCGVASLYRIFPSKGALLAELQRDAIDLLGTSLQLGQAHLDELLERRGVEDPRMVALTRLVVASRFWVAAEDHFPLEIDLFRRIFTDPGEVLDDEAVVRAAPATFRLLDTARGLVEAAQSTGALSPGQDLDRAVVLVSSTSGVLMISGLQRFGSDLFDGRRLAGTLVTDLLAGWGASPADLTTADGYAAELADRGRLVPPVAS